MMFVFCCLFFFKSLSHSYSPISLPSVFAYPSSGRFSPARPRRKKFVRIRPSRPRLIPRLPVFVSGRTRAHAHSGLDTWTSHVRDTRGRDDSPRRDVINTMSYMSGDPLTSRVRRTCIAAVMSMTMGQESENSGDKKKNENERMRGRERQRNRPKGERTDGQRQ